MKLLEIHKNGINANNKTVSYYGLDYEKKKVLFEVKTLEEAIENEIHFCELPDYIQFSF